jgi:hypothetical protein
MSHVSADAPHQAAPEAPIAKTRRRLFTKYVALFVAVVCVALVSNGIFDVFFYYQEHKASLIRIQREQAEAAAGKIGQFIKEIAERSQGVSADAALSRAVLLQLDDRPHGLERRRRGVSWQNTSTAPRRERDHPCAAMSAGRRRSRLSISRTNDAAVSGRCLCRASHVNASPELSSALATAIGPHVTPSGLRKHSRDLPIGPQWETARWKRAIIPPLHE